MRAIRIRYHPEHGEDLIDLLHVTLSEFRHVVEAMELWDPGDSVAQKWRGELQRIDPSAHTHAREIAK